MAACHDPLASHRCRLRALRRAARGRVIFSASVSTPIVMSAPFAKPLRGRWRSWVASCALVTLAWPSLGLLPWVGMDLTATDHAAAHERAHLAANPSSAAHDNDSSDIPGSPTHPADHDCFQCQVLKHLARCVLSPLEPPTIPLQPGCAVQPRIVVESQFATDVAALPPARGPPLPNA